MKTKRHNITLESHETLVAQWETTGNDWLVLYSFNSPTWGVMYGYRGPNCGGGVVATSAEEAIAEMERGWGEGGKPGAGQAFVLKLDRPSLARVAA